MRCLWLILIFAAALAVAGPRSAMVNEEGRLVYPDAPAFAKSNNLATKDDINAATGGGSGAYPFVRIPMDADSAGKPVEVELKVKRYGAKIPDYWYSTLRDDNYLSFERRDVDARAWFMCQSKLAIGDERDWFPHLSNVWANISDQLTDMSLGVHMSPKTDVCDIGIEPNVRGRFPDGRPVKDVWSSFNGDLKPTFARLGLTGNRWGWRMASIEWLNSPREMLKYEYADLAKNGAFHSSEDSGYFTFGEGGEITVSGAASQSILFTSVDKVFDYYGQSIVAFSVSFPESWAGSATISFGMLNRHEASNTYVSRMCLMFVGNVDLGSSWESIYEPVFTLGPPIQGAYMTTTAETVDDFFEQAAAYSFDSTKYAGTTVRVVGVISPYDHQAEKKWTHTEISQAYGTRTWERTFKFGSPAYNILGMFLQDVPAGTKITNVKVITWH